MTTFMIKFSARRLAIASVMAGWACALSLAAANTARAEMLGAVTSDELAAAMTAAGLSPTMLEDAETGAPVANGRAGEVSFFVRALSCAGRPPACENLMFFANFELGRAATTQDYRAINSFNDSQVFGRAYILEDQRQIGVDYVIELGGGVSPAHLAGNISRWSDVIAAFMTAMREGAPGS